MQKQQYDIFIFAGQSNMAGRGVVSSKFPDKAPAVNLNAGLEFRAISDPTRLYKIQEPFGLKENNPNGIYEPGKKTGSLVSSFANAYFYTSSKSMIAISASKGGSSILEWLPGTPFYADLTTRLKSCVQYLKTYHLNYQHIYLVWCQGETDGDHKMPKDTYMSHFNTLIQSLMEKGIEHCFLIQIGHFNPNCSNPPSFLPDYSEIIAAQKELATTNPNVTMVSTRFEKMLQNNMMKDAYHYYQTAYNMVGLDAGITTAKWVLSHSI